MRLLRFNPHLYKKLFPNPANNFINVQLSAASLPAILELFGADGKRVLKQQLENENQQIRLNKITTGIFIVKISDKNGYFNTKKILINK